MGAGNFIVSPFSGAAANGEVLAGLFMRKVGGNGVLGFSRNSGKDWTFANEGAVVLTSPSGIAKDFSIIYDSVNARYLAFYTLVVDSTDFTHFGVSSSTDLVSWTEIATIPVGANVTVWGPTAYKDSNGNLHVFVAASTLASTDPGLNADLRIFHSTPVSAWNPTSFNTWVQLTMPTNNTGWNEVFVFDTDNRDGAGSSGIRMAVNAFGSAGSNIKILRPNSASSLGGTWSLVATLTETDEREGVFVIQKPISGFRVLTTYGAGTPDSYQYNDYSSTWTNGTGLNPCRRFPDTVQMENGQPILISGRTADAFAIQQLDGSMAEQSSTLVSITGGTAVLSTLAATSNVAVRGVDDSFTVGYRCELSDGTLKRLITIGSGGNFGYDFLPSGGLTFGPLSGFFIIGGIYTDGWLIGASGIKVTQWRHGITTLVAGTKVVSDSTITANTRIFLTAQSLGTVSAAKALAVTARSAGVSFTITSADATDTSVVAYQLIEP